MRSQRALAIDGFTRGTWGGTREGDMNCCVSIGFLPLPLSPLLLVLFLLLHSEHNEVQEWNQAGQVSRKQRYRADTTVLRKVVKIPAAGVRFGDLNTLFKQMEELLSF